MTEAEGEAQQEVESLVPQAIIVNLILFIVVCAAALYCLRFFKTSKEPKDQGFTDQITEGDSVYVGFVDNTRPDLRNRPGKMLCLRRMG